MRIILVIFTILFFTTNAQAKKITIFACEPEWGAIAREIVKDRADVVVATLGVENPYLKIDRSFTRLEMMRNADLVFCSGAGLEDLWLPELLKRSTSPQIKSGEAVIMAADYIKPLSHIITKPRMMARVHLNPNNIPIIAAKFLEVLIKVEDYRNPTLSGNNSSTYKYNFKMFDERFRKSIDEWNGKAASLKGLPVVLRNDAWAYLVDWLQLDVVAKIENDKGVEKNVFELEKILKEKPAKLIIFADFERNKQLIYDLSKKMQTRVVFLPFTVGGVAGTYDIFRLYNNTINRLLVDCSKVTCQGIGYSRSLSQYLQYDQTRVQQDY